jgi:alkyl hydroperoxide reductase subunit AhpC
MKNYVFWDFMPCDFVFVCSMHRLLVVVNVVPSSPILVTLMMEALSSSETSVFKRATWRNIPEDAILHWPFYLLQSLDTWIEKDTSIALCYLTY